MLKSKIPPQINYLKVKPIKVFQTKKNKSKAQLSNKHHQSLL